MPWPWEYDPVNSDGGGRVTPADRRRMALKYVIGLAGFAYLAATMNSKGLTHALSVGTAIALGGSACVDLLQLSRGGFDHIILKDHRQARLVAGVCLVLALGSGVVGALTFNR